MTQIHIYSAFLFLAWASLITRMWFRDGRLAEANTREFDKRDVARTGR